MSILDLRVRYFQDSTPVDVPCREENFVHRHIKMPLSLSETALVLAAREDQPGALRERLEVRSEKLEVGS